jgi:hypothetical protein
MAQQTVGARGVRRAVGVAAAVVVATVGVGAPVARGADTAWTKVASGTTGGISGLAPAAADVRGRGHRCGGETLARDHLVAHHAG